ncbi:hypothetical protein [Ruegeria lacuscaerulensis]|uniref:hypothetical protein n=1 Tax=Ruegeria lacuscaerulensis TaxID=55218 RepID=UPI00147C375D|nr:hypothetical protein [Ruegeria lacuscaerulensis]
MKRITDCHACGSLVVIELDAADQYHLTRNPDDYIGGECEECGATVHMSTRPPCDRCPDGVHLDDNCTYPVCGDHCWTVDELEDLSCHADRKEDA